MISGRQCALSRPSRPVLSRYPVPSRRGITRSPSIVEHGDMTLARWHYAKRPGTGSRNRRRRWRSGVKCRSKAVGPSVGASGGQTCSESDKHPHRSLPFRCVRPLSAQCTQQHSVTVWGRQLSWTATLWELLYYHWPHEPQHDR